jgi:hypothetical protein
MASDLYLTSWKFLTSREDSVTAFAVVGMGKIFLENTYSKERLTIAYRYVGLALGKGLPYNYSWSRKYDPSQGVGGPGRRNLVGFRNRRTFGRSALPAHGIMMSWGASLGVVGSVYGLDITGGGLTIMFFGVPAPFAALRIFGMGRSALPGIGPSVSAAYYGIDNERAED